MALMSLAVGANSRGASISIGGGSVTVAPADGSITFADTVGGQLATMVFSANPNPQSGTLGLRLIRDAANKGLGIGFWTGGVQNWDLGQDHTSTDLVLAYDNTLSADVFRFTQGGPWVCLRNGAATTVGERLRIGSNATLDSASLVTLLNLQIDGSGTSATHLAKGQVNGAALFGLSVNGELTLGRPTVSGSTIFAEFLRTTNERTYLRIQNADATASGSARVGIQLSNSADSFQFDFYGVNHSSSSVKGTAFFYTTGAKDFELGTNGTERLRLTSTGSIVLTKTALLTTATAGFVGLPSCAGAPTGVPETWTNNAGGIPIVIDSTNFKLYAWLGSAWKSVTLA